MYAELCIYDRAVYINYYPESAEYEYIDIEHYKNNVSNGLQIDSNSYIIVYVRYRRDDWTELDITDTQVIESIATGYNLSIHGIRWDMVGGISHYRFGICTSIGVQNPRALASTFQLGLHLNPTR